MKSLLTMLLLAVFLAASGAQQTAEKVLNIVVAWEPVAALAWDASRSAGVAGYHAYRSDFDGGPYARLNAAAIPGLSYDDETVEKGLTYYYVVTAVGDGGLESDFSNQAVAIIPQEK